MKIKYMGTAAAEGIPSLFCKCPVCENARQVGGREKKTRSQALINDDLLIDFPPDTYMHYQQYDFDLPGICNLLVTHCHTDHFYPTDLGMRCEPIAHPQPPIMRIYCNDTARRMFAETMPSENHVKDNFELIKPEPFQSMQVGAYRVTALLALHDRAQQCLFYEIEQGSHRLLYAHDTGNFPTQTWNYIEKSKKHYDLVSLDCTMMKIKDGGNHMGLEDDIEVKEKLMHIGVADQKTIFVVNHFSHNGGWTHAELVKQAEPHGFIVSYDGLEIEF